MNTTNKPANAPQTGKWGTREVSAPVIPRRCRLGDSGARTSATMARAKAAPMDSSRIWVARHGMAETVITTVEINVFPGGALHVKPLELRNAAHEAAGGGARTTSTSEITAFPAEGTTRVVQMLSKVVLPAPFGPNNPKSSPRFTARSTPSSAATFLAG
jgi:hypothetical protein